MVIRSFPPLSRADETGLIAVGGDLEVESLLLAYRSGIFPWPMDEHLLTWYSPPKRAIITQEDFHESRSLRKAARNESLGYSVDTAFPAVIENCAALINRGSQRGTWITDAVCEAYLAFHSAGYAHSVECFEGSKLIGGLYGIALGGMFAGESMFYRKANGSKLALAFLMQYLKLCGVAWIDCQQLTPHAQALGAKTVARQRFIQMLHQAIECKVLLFPPEVRGTRVHSAAELFALRKESKYS